MKKYDLFLNTNICTMLDHVSSRLISSLSADGIFSRFCQLYFSPFVTSRSTPLRPPAQSGVFDIHYHKILKISPGAYIFQRPFQRGLFLEGLIYGGKNKLSFKIVQAYTWEGNLRLKINWASLYLDFMSVICRKVLLTLALKTQTFLKHSRARTSKPRVKSDLHKQQ